MNMHRFSKETLLNAFFLVLALISFLGFGLYHLGLFETTDEHLWKYDRIGTYWQALGDGDLAKTYINDKPGITVALVSGIGLLSEPHPEKTEKRSLDVDNKGLFEAYDSTQAVITNVHFRLPILLISLGALVAFYFLAAKVLESRFAALFSTLFVATNPLLVGMAQIINPDSFFWIFGSLATLAYLLVLKEPKPRFILLAGILTGFALLSKYTAFLLFFLFALFLLITGIQRTWDARTWLYCILHLVVIFGVSVATFSVLLPAVLLNPELLFKGLSQFLNPKALAGIFVLFILFALTSFLIWRFGRTQFVALYSKSKKMLPLISSLIAALFMILFLVSLLNVWTGQKISPVDALRDAAYANEPQAFNFKPVLEKSVSDWEKMPKLFLMNSYPLIFTLSPLVLLTLAYGCVLAFRRRQSEQEQLLFIGIGIFLFAYLILTLEAKVVTNARYLIILYPLLALLAGSFLSQFVENLKTPQKRLRVLALVAAAILLFGVSTLFVLRPFYFSYETKLLPAEYSVHDSWGHGSYEAAQYLNSLPDAENLVIWSNSDTVCRFFEGKCLRSRHIDLAKVTPDFFVLSKRGTLKERNHFILENNPHSGKDARYYIGNLEQKSVWSLLINHRSDNAIRIIPFEKE